MSKESASDWFNKGIEYIRADKYKEALECLKKVIEIDPEYEDVWFQLGWVYSYLWEIEKAVESYEKAVSLEPKNYQAWYNLGKKYQDEYEDYKKAIKCYEKVLEISPKFSYAWNNMGLAYENLNDRQKATECYEKSVNYDPDNQIAWINYAINQYFLKNYLKSLECYAKAMEINPLDFNAQMSLEAAMESISKKIELNNQNKDLWLKMSEIYIKLKQYVLALNCLKGLIELDRYNFDVWHNLGTVYHELDDHKSFLEQFGSRAEVLEDLKRVSIITTSQGPIYPDIFWLIESSSEIGIIPSEGPDSNFLDEVQKLSGFDNKEVIKAMTSTDDNIFICWEKRKQNKI